MTLGALLAAVGCAESERPARPGSAGSGAGGASGYGWHDRRRGSGSGGSSGGGSGGGGSGGSTAGSGRRWYDGRCGRRGRQRGWRRGGVAAARCRHDGGGAGAGGNGARAAAVACGQRRRQRRSGARAEAAVARAAWERAAAAPSGTAGLGGGSLCTAGRYLLCEGFEGPVGNTPPTGWSRHGNATIADDQAARGAHALKLTPAADKGYGFFVYGNAEAFGAAHWGRLFYRVQTPPPDAFVHATMAAYHGDGPGIGASTFRVADTVKMAAPTSTHQFLFNVQITGDREFGKGGPYNWSFDGNWHCAEWFVDGANQAYQFYFDGTEVTQIRIQNGAANYGSGSNETHLPMMFNDFRVGWTTYQNAPPGFTAWIDEVAIDAQPHRLRELEPFRRALRIEDLAEHARPDRAGDGRDVAGRAEQRLVGEHRERDRFLRLRVDAQRGAGRDRDRREQLGEVAHQHRVQRAAARDEHLVGHRRQHLAVAARDRLGGEPRQRREQVVVAVLVAREQRVDEVLAERLASGRLRQRLRQVGVAVKLGQQALVDRRRARRAPRRDRTPRGPPTPRARPCRAACCRGRCRTRPDRRGAPTPASRWRCRRCSAARAGGPACGTAGDRPAAPAARPRRRRRRRARGSR